MNSEIKKSFTASLVLHGVLMANITIFMPVLVPQIKQTIEVNYFKPKEEPLTAIEKIKAGPGLDAQIDQNIMLKDVMKIHQPLMIKQAQIRPDTVKEDFFARKTLDQKKIAISRQDLTKKKVSLPMLEPSGIKNPVYLSYFNSLRVKIRQLAYRNYDRFEEGSVYLTFAINSDGKLQESRVVNEKSNASPTLKQIAPNSIKEASPYPAFPKNLDYPQLTFNVIISFELNQN